MPKIEYFDPYLEKKNPEYKYAPPKKMPFTPENPECKQLWDNAMLMVRDKSGKTVKAPADPVCTVFGRKVVEFLDRKGLRASEVYKRAGIPKSTWNKYIGEKLTTLRRANVYSVAIGLELNEEETAELLYSAGYAINYDLDLDCAMMYFIKHKMYDISEIKSILAEFSDIERGIDCFAFEPATPNQEPLRVKIKIAEKKRNSFWD